MTADPTPATSDPRPLGPTAVAIAASLYDIEDAVASLDIDSAHGAEELPIEHAARFLARARAARTTLQEIEAIYERWIAAIFDHEKWQTGYKKPHRVNGVGDVEVTFSRTTTWDSEALLKAWTEAFLADRQGEAEPWDITHEMARALGVVKADGEWATSAPWRAGPLRDLGVDPKEYNAVEWGAPKVKVELVSNDD